MAGRYAEGTTVSVDSSRGEITGILAKHGVVRMAWATEPDRDVLQFELGDHQYRLTMDRPTAESLRAERSREYSYPHNVDWDAKAAQEWRRRWRANVLLLKAKLEFAQGDGPSTIERELMPYMVVAGGRTLEEAIADGGVKMLVAGNGR